jgi:hypothetical protein
MIEGCNMLEQWSRWEPIEGLGRNYYLDGLVDNIDELIVRLSSEQDQSLGVEVRFDSALCYRVSEEGFRQDAIRQLHLKYGDDFYAQWAFFKIDESGYLDWLSRESYELSNYIGLTHYCLKGLEGFIDIAASSEPIVKLIKL